MTENSGPPGNAVLVTGAAGFIGSHLSRRLCADGHHVVGLDNLNPYYDVALKHARLGWVAQAGFTFVEADVVDAARVLDLMRAHGVKRVVHLAAQAGVRHSLAHPFDYTRNNIEGFLSILEACRAVGVEHLVYASSSSIYGASGHQPFEERAPSVHPVSLYAATKRANELMAHAYSHLFQIPASGLRFFTVYGPWGRPDMALFHFTRSILRGEPIELYNQGDMQRDFTYIDDVVEGIVRVLGAPPTPDAQWDPKNPDPASSSAPWRVLNVGSSRPVHLLEFVRAIEAALGREAKVILRPLQPGDAPSTFASTEALHAAVGYRPGTSIHEGVTRFVDWYMDYFGAGPDFEAT